jgi:hypothetical protein
MFDEENQDFLTHFVLLWIHVVVGMRYEPWLEYSCQICCGHEVLCRVFCEYR